MSHDTRKHISRKYCPRFGQIAVESSFINEAQLAEALTSQVRMELNGQGRRLLGEILFEKEWMTASQIEQVMTALLNRMRNEEI